MDKPEDEWVTLMKPRDKLLWCAGKLINGDRQGEYGPPVENHKRIAKIWSAITGVDYAPETVAAMMIGLKLARLGERTDHMDSWVDIAGYAALGWEMHESQEGARGQKKNMA